MFIFTLFSKRSNSNDFMDVTISLVDNKVEFVLYEKKLALHLYLPPHSSHPPGVVKVKGLVMGEVLRIFQLCTHDKDIDDNLSKFLDDYSAVATKRKSSALCSPRQSRTPRTIFR